MAEAGGCAGLLTSGRYDTTTFIFVLFLFPQVLHFLSKAFKRVSRNLGSSAALKEQELAV